MGARPGGWIRSTDPVSQPMIIAKKTVWHALSGCYQLSSAPFPAGLRHSGHMLPPLFGVPQAQWTGLRALRVPSCSKHSAVRKHGQRTNQAQSCSSFIPSGTVPQNPSAPYRTRTGFADGSRSVGALAQTSGNRAQKTIRAPRMGARPSGWIQMKCPRLATYDHRQKNRLACPIGMPPNL